jgi:hypothetical protein
MALDHSLDALQGPASAIAGPRWIRDRFAWGPSSWPLHWCEAVESAQLDCGALSALTREIYLQRDVAAVAAQVIQRYSAQTVAHWRRKWRTGFGYFDWLAEDLIYHEVVGVLLNGAVVKIWDPSNACWIAHDHTRGYGATLEIRLMPPSPALGGAVVHWGDRQLRLGSWNDLEEAASPPAGLDGIPPVGP